VMNQFRRDASVHAVDSGLLENTRTEAEKRLRETLPNESWKLIIFFQEAESDSAKK